MRRKTFFPKQRLRAFSLPELLVVLVIIGILVLVALPNLMPLISRAKSTEAQQQLTFLHTLQQSNFYTYSRYSGSLEELGFEQSRLVTEGGQANYVIEVVEPRSTVSGPLLQPSLISTGTGFTTCGKSIRTSS